jgi:hypothetical protein
MDNVWTYEVIILVLVIAIVGGLSNFLAIYSNSCKMPVFNLEYEPSSGHSVFTNFSQVKYPYLTDIIKISVIYFSIGDLLMYSALGALLIVLFTYIVKRNKYKRLASALAL